MNEKEILEYNKRCALFLGAIYSKQAEAWGFGNAKNIGSKMFHGVMYHNVVQAERFEKELKFHSDWNWIMDMVEAIEKLTKQDGYGYEILITNSLCVIEETNKIFDSNQRVYAKTTKEAVVGAINQFLIWYEQNK
jgi:hypothetical protein